MLLVARFGMGKAGSIGPIIPAFTGPGPTTLAYGDATMGFFGEVPSSSFISGSALATAIGLTAGALSYDTPPWLKFILDGKILFIPKMHIRTNISWQDIYQAGAVYGDSTYGSFPAGANRLQNASVAIAGKNYTVKLLSGSKGDNATPDGGGTDILISQGNNEWNRLLYPLSTKVVASYTGPKWNLYADAELDITRFGSWCRDKSIYNADCRIVRGGNYVSYFNKYFLTDSVWYIGWRPCLILQ